MQSYNNNTLLGFASGLAGGISSFILDIKIGVMNDMIIAIITAFMCGVTGIAAKDVYQFAKRKFFKKKK